MYDKFLDYEIGKFTYKDKKYVFGISNMKLTILELPVKLSDEGNAIPQYPHKGFKKIIASRFRNKLTKLFQKLKDNKQSKTGAKRPLKKEAEVLMYAIEDVLKH